MHASSMHCYFMHVPTAVADKSRGISTVHLAHPIHTVGLLKRGASTWAVGQSAGLIAAGAALAGCTHACAAPCRKGLAAGQAVWPCVAVCVRQACAVLKRQGSVRQQRNVRVGSAPTHSLPRPTYGPIYGPILRSITHVARLEREQSPIAAAARHAHDVAVASTMPSSHALPWERQCP